MPLTIEELEIPEVKLIKPARFYDNRGFFTEAYNKVALQAVGIEFDFVQDNESISIEAGTLRGLHFQAAPYDQTKLIRVLSGAILDIAVDVRDRSPTYGCWVKAEISAESGKQVLVPRGFLHGYMTLEPNTHVLYKVDTHYNQEAEGCVAWNDPDLAIDWGPLAKNVILSDKDKTAPLFANFQSGLKA
ncbi:MAG: dTDP-4-dehydrorhamnose 3,5-epimerase [Henriciella sp.]